jgi:endonuclease/exonuclease/phosphatase family metal-dependent hydrolase
MRTSGASYLCGPLAWAWTLEWWGCGVAEFRMLTWNVQNLFAAGTKDGPPTQQAFDAKLGSLAEVLDAQRPDVAALQELGPPEVLAQLQQLLGHQLPHRQLSEHPDGRGIRVGFLSRLPLEAPVQLHPLAVGLSPVQVGDDDQDPATPLPTTGTIGRGALQVTVTAHGHPLTILTAHLKSKLLTFPGDRFQPRDEAERARFGAYALYLRAAQAATLRAHLEQLLDDAGRTMGVVVAGDLNDGLDAATTQLLQGPPGSELDTPGFARPDGGDGQRMWNLAPLIPEAQRFTRVFRGRGELIDHVLVSHFLVTKTRQVTTAMASPGRLRSITENPREELGKPGSDHAAVVASFELPS